MDVEDARAGGGQPAPMRIIVSNHGGRQLDGAPSSIEALPAIADEVGSRSRGATWTAASARARTCSRPGRWARAAPTIGRAFLYGLGAMGEAGVDEGPADRRTRSSTSRWPSAAARGWPTSDRSILLPGTFPKP
jgi:L-lactate dehydrogenase (cytochrome)